jgi:hypothetical protein
MADDEDDDLYEEEFDFVDDEEDDLDEEVDEVEDDEPEEAIDEGVDQDADQEADQEGDVDEYGRPSPTANYVVHVYEFNKFKRTIDRPFTPEDAESFATEYNRTGKPYGRVAVAGKNDAKPKKSLD